MKTFATIKLYSAHEIMFARREKLGCFELTREAALETCDLDELLTGAKELRIPKSGSKAVVVLGTLALDGALRDCWPKLPRDVALKIYYRDIDREAVELERELYEVTNELFLKHWTPHVALYLGGWECRLQTLFPNRRRLAAPLRRARESALARARKFGDEEDVERAQKRLQRVQRFESARGDEEAAITMIERGEADLHSAIRTGRLSDDELRNVLFQIVWTLYIFDRVGVRHADLHSGNVLVDALAKPQRVAYVLDPRPSGKSTYFELNERNLAKVFDWDWGGVYDPPEESGLLEAPNAYAEAQCDRVSSCGRNSKADMFTLLADVYRQTDAYPTTRALIEEIISPRLLEFAPAFEEYGGQAFRLCDGPIADDCDATFVGDACDGAWEPRDCLIKTPAQALEILGAPNRHAFPQRKPRTAYVYGYFTDEKTRKRFTKK